MPRAERSAAGHDRGPAARSARLARGLPLPARCPFRIEHMRRASRAAAESAPAAHARVLGDAGGRACCTPPKPRRSASGRPAPRATAASAAPLLGGARPRQAFRAAARELLRAASRAARRRWRRSRRAARRDRRAGRRIRLRQVDAGAAGHAPPRADRGLDPLRRPGHRARVASRHPAAAAAHADDVPGPVRLAQPAHDGRRDPRRAAALPRHRRRRGAIRDAGRRTARPRRPADRSRRSAIRTNSPAASVSASRSRARSRCEPDFIVADEPISALDVNIQAQIINLMIDLQERLRPDLSVHRARSRGGAPHLATASWCCISARSWRWRPASGSVRAAAASLHAQSDLGRAGPRSARSSARASACRCRASRRARSIRPAAAGFARAARSPKQRCARGGAAPAGSCFRPARRLPLSWTAELGQRSPTSDSWTGRMPSVKR